MYVTGQGYFFQLVIVKELYLIVQVFVEVTKLLMNAEFAVVKVFLMVLVTVKVMSSIVIMSAVEHLNLMPVESVEDKESQKANVIVKET
jgi:hypothetical protein